MVYAYVYQLLYLAFPGCISEPLHSAVAPQAAIFYRLEKGIRYEYMPTLSTSELLEVMLQLDTSCGWHAILFQVFSYHPVYSYSYYSGFCFY